MSVNTTATLTQSTLKMFFRNRQALFFTLIMPFIFIGIFGLIGFDKVPKINVGIVANHPDQPTEAFIQTLGKFDAFKTTRGNVNDEKVALNKGDRVVVLLVPDHLFPVSGAKTVTPQTITVLKNVSQEQLAGTAISIMTQILDKTTLQVAKAPNLFKLDVQDVSAKRAKYIDFLLPGIVAMSIMQMAVFSVGFVFTDYKERGILKRLIATPMKPYQFVTANVITRLIMALFQTISLLGVGILVFHSHVYGAWWLIFLISLLGGVMFLGLGFTISGMAKTVDAVPAIANLIVFPMLFLSGVFFPTNAMPDWLQKIVSYLPLQHFAHSMREVVANGATISNISRDLYWMLAWAVVLIFTANLTFGFEEKRQ